MDRELMEKSDASHMAPPVLIIPAYEPGDNLIDMVKRLTELGHPHIVIVNDDRDELYDHNTFEIESPVWIVSRKSTPPWLRLTSPGRGCEPPPTRAAVETV